MKTSKEFVGTLRGFDDYVNVVLDDVTEYEGKLEIVPLMGCYQVTKCPPPPRRLAVSAEGKRTASKLDSILLNGNGISMLVPGSSPEDAYVGPKPSGGV